MKYAPIAIFCYKRLNHLEKLIQALQKDHLLEKSEIYFFIDGPKKGTEGSVENVYEFISKLNIGLRKHILKKEQNIGLSKSIISGVNHVLDRSDSVIVLEDDLIPNELFLSYCNQALLRYGNDSNVGCIHGYTYPIDNDSQDCFFRRGGDCWGWATWKRSWKLFNSDSQTLLNDLKARRLTWKFDLEGAYPFTTTLENCLLKKNDSWAIRWHASLFLAEKYCLYPPNSLIKNTGLDSSGTHCRKSKKYEVKHISKSATFKFPSKTYEDQKIFKKIKNFHKPGRKTFKLRYLFEFLINNINTPFRKFYETH